MNSIFLSEASLAKEADVRAKRNITKTKNLIIFS